MKKIVSILTVAIIIIVTFTCVLTSAVAETENYEFTCSNKTVNCKMGTYYAGDLVVLSNAVSIADGNPFANPNMAEEANGKYLVVEVTLNEIIPVTGTCPDPSDVILCVVAQSETTNWGDCCNGYPNFHCLGDTIKISTLQLPNDFSVTSDKWWQFRIQLRLTDECPANINAVKGQSKFDAVVSVRSYISDKPCYEGVHSLKDPNVEDGFTYLPSENGFALSEYTGHDENVVIPSEFRGLPVTSIKNSAFCFNDELKSVTIPDTVTDIGAFAFKSCQNLKSVKFSKNLKSIGESAFSNCNSLTQIEIPESVSQISYDAFGRCTKLESVKIPEGVEYIKNFAFLDCDSLKEITIPKSVTTINQYALGYYFHETEYVCEFVVKDDFTIKGYAGSEAQKYANDNNIKFIDIESYGDINADKHLDIIDVSIARAYIVGAKQLTDEEIKTGDLNGDNLLDIIDVAMMRSAIVNG